MHQIGSMKIWKYFGSSFNSPSPKIIKDKLSALFGIDILYDPKPIEQDKQLTTKSIRARKFKSGTLSKNENQLTAASIRAPSSKSSTSSFALTKKPTSSKNLMNSSKNTQPSLPDKTPIGKKEDNLFVKTILKKLPYSFEDFKLPSEIIHNLKMMRIFAPNPHQIQIIQAITNKQNTKIQTPTGSGKTLGIVVGLILKILSTANTVRRGGEKEFQSLFLVPTHTLAEQIKKWIDNIAGGLISAYVQYPNGPKSVDLDTIQVLISTPRTLLESHLWSSSQNIIRKRCSLLIIDEADALFKAPSIYASKVEKIKRLYRKPPQMIQILEYLTRGGEKQTEFQIAVISASLNAPTRAILRKYNLFTSTRPGIFIKHEEGGQNEVRGLIAPAASLIAHKYLLHNEECNDIPLSVKIHSIVAQFHSTDNGIIFIVGDHGKKALFHDLIELGLPVTTLKALNQEGEEGEKAQPKIYLASHAECRGVNLEGIKFVMIINLPETAIDYLHMAGRTGRMNSGGAGTVYSFVKSAEEGILLAFEKRILNVKFTKQELNMDDG